MAYNPFRDGKQTQSTQTGRVNPFRQTSADRSDRERVMRNWQSDAEQHGILNNPQYTDEGKAYQQYAKEYAQYGRQYQTQLSQGMTGRQWAADVNKRLEELQAQQRAAQQTERRRQDADAIGDPGLWVTTTEQYDALPEARRQEEARRAKQRPAVSLADYDKRIAELRKEKEWADYFADAGLSDEVGYKTGSAAGQVAYKQAQAAKPANPREELEKQREAGEMDLATYQKYYQSTGDNRSAYWKYGTDTAWKEPSDSWTKDELTNFYYLYNESASEAEKYAERVNNKYNAAKAQEKKDEIGERAAKNGWTGFGATLASIPLTMTSLMDTAERAAEYSARGTVTQKADLTPADIGMAMTSAIYSALNEKSGTINDNIPVVGGKGLGDLYETGVSVLNSLASVYMLGGVGTYANFFGQASKSAYEEGIQRGLSVDKALTYGYASGVAEVAGEIFSIEHLIKMKNPSSLKGIIKNIFVQGGIEASEESSTTLMNTISDAIINGDKSELASNYYALIQAGYSSEEASQLAISDWTQGIMYDALGGFVSGVASAGVQSTVQGSMTYKGDAQELIDYAKSEGADTAAGKRAQKYEKRVQSGKRMTNYQAGTLTELAQEAVVSKDLDNIREAVGKRLSALGENNSALTEAVVRQAVQQEAEAADVSVPKVTEKQRGLIQNSKAAKRVLSEMDIGNMRMETAAELSGHDSSQYQRSNEWARDIGTRIIAPGEYGVRSTNTVTAEEKRADVTVNGESGKVVGFKNGMARVEVTENGKSTIREVKPDDVQQLPKQTRRLFDEISRYDGDTQAAMYAAYMPGQDIEAYVQAADTAMNLYGAQTKATLEQARSFGKATFRMLSDAQLDALMQAGRKLADQRKAAAERTGESKGEVKQGKVAYDVGEADGRERNAPSKEAIDRMSDAEKTLAEALTATGVNVVFYESEANAEGRYSGAQGMYHNGTVYLDVNAGMNSVESGQRTIVLTAAHEMTHFIRENSEAGYIALREFITGRLMQQGLDIEELVTQKRARESRELSYDEAVEEVIADACETVLTEPTAIQQLASDNMPLAKKIRKWISDFFTKIKSAFAGLEAVHDEAKAMTDYMDELRAMWDSALADAVRNRANKNAAENGGKFNNNTSVVVTKLSARDAEAARSADAVGIQYDSETESANPIKYFLRTWNESSYVQDREKAAAELSTVLKISKAKALKYIDDINAIAKLIADDRGRLDYEASPGRSSFVGNSEYGGSIDFSTICKKRRLLTGTLEAIQRALPNTALTAEEILSIRKMMADKGYEVSCGLCYVEGSRANMGKYTKEFLEEYAATNPEYLPNMAEMNTATGQETIRREHPEVYAAYEKYMNKLAQRKPKLYQLATEYQGEIRNKFKGKGSVESKNLNGGMRLQSFSDFEIIHLIDCMQVIMDMAEVGLAGQAYTKVPDFAWALGGTGLKINLSLIAKGVDANGNLVLDETEGMHRADAEKLRNAYSQNVGTILVVFNDEQLTAAMQDDFIDFIIPFHRSQWNSTQYNLLGLPAGAKDYTPWQNESYIEPVYNKNGKKQRPANYMPNEYWDFSKSGKENAETYLKMCAANNRKPKFSMLLDKNADGSYSLKEDGSTDGYWKLLIDFKMYDNDGVGMPQQPVKPIFNMDESERMLREYTGGHNAFPAANDVVSEFVSEYKAKNGDARYSRSSSENSNTKIKKSERDAEYLSAVKRGDLETARSMVNEAAEDAEYDITAYHVSMNGAFNVFDRNRLGENTVDYADDAAAAATAYLGFWFSDHDVSKPTRNYGMIPGDARQFRLKAEALYPIALQTLQDELLNEYISEDAIEQYSAGEYSAIREAAEEYAAELQRRGYSGLKVQDSELGGTSYVVFDPEQIKSAEPVVYDDNGKVIPLSERFNSKSRDIRYSNRDVDLTAKYPQLNLNEDISELDGVPAIELTDGSVLPITERDGRYPTHVSFIEANRIDVDDLKSGGWIGNGVYDPSFTSDTQRYIERQQARKRVAELTGKPYEQFRYSMRDDAMTDRELLARALDSVAATESERKLLAQYRTEFDRYQELYDKLDDAQIEYSAARRAVDDAYAQAKRSKLTAEERRRTESAWRERIGALKATQQETREARDKLLKEVDAQDRKLLKLRAMNPVKDMLSRARADMRETIKARQSKTDARAKVRDMAKKLSDLLLKESKDKHVLLELQKPVAEVLDMLNLDTVNAAERVAKYDAAIARTTDPEMKRELAETRDRIQAQGDRLKTRLDALHTAYQAIANSADPTVANGYDENIAAKMQEVSQLVGDTPLAKMTQEQLDAVHDLLKMTYTVVSKANKAFVLNQKAGIEERAQAEIDRLSATEGADLGLKPVQFAKRQFWSMLKPGEIFHKVGGELEQAYNEVRKGEDVRARDVVTARSFFQQAAEKHGYFSWALEEKHDFVSAQGRPFSLSLDDMMSVYATSRREQGKKHLAAGGIVFGKNGKIKVKKKGVTLTMSQIKARAYTLDEQVLDEIIGKLTPEQKAFVEEMENWISTKPAEWGNEVSRELYGINLFKEKVYWPIKSASEYLQSRSGDSDNVKIKNSGFTRSTVEKANNPIYIGGFVDTWSQHVYEMATYHGFTLPLEDFTRIFNYATSASDIENGANSVKAMLTNAFGSEAPVQQIELLLKDVNGSARSDPTTELMNKGLAFMKKYAVAGSLSVSIQQPSAIARATAYIDPKYFAGEKITAEKHKELWEHMKKYAPVAAIKEIGYFDQGLGRSAREWMTAREYDGLAEKAKGLVTDSNYRSDVIMALPGLMDELTWCSIWQAVEREVADTTNLKTGSEEFNKRVGDRFTQIITETQVYDSVFSRSAMMRSKDVGVKMATAFMAEPLTNVSMVVDAIDDFRNGRTALGARKLGSVVASMLLNSILVSFVYAARNDDDDKSYIEKYIAALTGELKDGFNPLTYIPYIKDVVSIVQGYDVERNDMTMIADLWNAYTSLKSDKKSTYRKIEDFAGRIAQIFGLPLKNVMRDMRAAYYTYDTIANGEETTWKGALQAIAEGWTGESPSNSEQLYDALVSGNAKQADRVKARFEDESAAQAAVKKVIREKFAPTDGGKQSIDKQTAIKQLQDYAGMSKQEAEKQVAKWTVSLAYGFEYGDTKDEYLNGNITIDKAKRVLMGAGATDMEADAKTLQWKFEKDTGIAYDDMSDAYVSGDISRSDAVNYLVKYGKTYRADAEATVQQWQCEKDTGFKYSELKDLYVAGTISADRTAALRSKYGGASEDDAKSTVLQWQCVKDTGIEYSDIRKAYEEKRVSGETVENMLMKYGGKSKDDAAARREKYDFTIANPGTEDISDAAVQKYNESVAAAGISGKDYYTSWQMYNRTESDYDENGKPISYSKLYKIAAYIDSLNLTNAQKDAMFCAFYTARNLRRTPWH
nr:MAG TPA: chromosome segregation protein [Caudoviricetes sp.]